jgi:outer membrane protein OmpA-like peptidoglycan-associated protein
MIPQKGGNMTFRSILAMLTAAAMFSGCTDRYQELLRDRDAQIRQLNGQVASAQGRADTAERDAAQTKSEYDKLRAEYEKGGKAAENANAGLKDLLGPGVDISWRRGQLSLGVRDEVTFDSGSATLKSSAGHVLDGVVRALKQKFSDRRFYVSGHTDSDPIVKTKDKYKDNLDLSLVRAEAVARYLMEHGVASSHIAVIGYGQYDPKGDKKEQNRRVEIVVGEALGSK